MSSATLRQDTIAVALTEYDDGARTHPAQYWATSAFLSSPTDNPPNQLFDRIGASIEISREVSCLFWANDRTPTSIGSIRLRNEDGALDALDDDTVRDRELKIYLGKKGQYFNDFALIATGVGDRLDFPDEREALAVSIDRGASFERALQTVLYTSTENEVLEGRLKPIAIGSPLSCPVPMVEFSTLTFDAHDAVPYGITLVRDKGFELIPVTQWIASGVGFYLLQQPEGDIVADIQGAKVGGTLITRLPDVLEYLLVTRGGISSGDVDWDSIDDLDTAAPYDLSIWIDQPTTIGEVLTSVLDSYGGSWFFDRQGKFKVWRLEAPTGTADLTIAEWQLDQLPLRRWLDRAPGLSTAVVGARNWHVYTQSQLATALLDPNVLQIALDLQQTYRRRRVGGSPAAEYMHAYGARGGGRTDVEKRADGMPTLFNDVTALQAEATRRATLYAVKRNFWEIPVRMEFSDALELEPGMQVHVTARRFGLQGGKLLRVVGLRIRTRDSAVLLKCWG